MNQTIFVFGSNYNGYHGAGAAKTAVDKYHAITGLGMGPQNYAYAVPTKDGNMRPLPRLTIGLYARQFGNYARIHWRFKTEYVFMVTRIGCGYAGYKDEEMATLFADCPPNCTFDRKWSQWLGPLHNYWGTYP